MSGGILAKGSYMQEPRQGQAWCLLFKNGAESIVSLGAGSRARKRKVGHTKERLERKVLCHEGLCRLCELLCAIVISVEAIVRFSQGCDMILFLFYKYHSFCFVYFYSNSHDDEEHIFDNIYSF